jgi:flagellar protein FliO/FliZ
MITDADLEHPLLRVLNTRAQPKIEPTIRILPAEDHVTHASHGAAPSCQQVGQNLFTKLSEIWQRTSAWTKRHVAVRQRRKRLKVCESVSLGEKRFVAVIQVDGQQFLVGGASNSIAMLAQLDKQAPFSDLLRDSCTQEQVQ